MNWTLIVVACLAGVALIGAIYALGLQSAYEYGLEDGKAKGEQEPLFDIHALVDEVAMQAWARGIEEETEG